MTLNRIGRTPLGALYRSALGVRTSPSGPKIFVAGSDSFGYTANLTESWRGLDDGLKRCRAIAGIGVWLIKSNQNPALCSISDGTEIWSYSFTAWNIDVDASGNCYAWDRTSRRLIKLDQSGSLVWDVTLPGSSSHYPSSMTFLVSGSLIYLIKYVVGGPNNGEPQIHSYSTADGSLSVSFPEVTGGDAFAVSPYSGDLFCALRVPTIGIVEVAKIERYTQSGSFVTSWTCEVIGSPTLFLRTPRAIDIDASGYVYIAGQRPLPGFGSGHSVQKWTESGTFVYGVALDTNVYGIDLTSAGDKLVLCGRRLNPYYGPDADRVMILRTSDGATLNDVNLTAVPASSPTSISTIL